MTAFQEYMDLRGIPCPANTARILLKLETMPTGDVLKVTLDDGEPMENVPPALLEQDHVILEKVLGSNRTWDIFIKNAS